MLGWLERTGNYKVHNTIKRDQQKCSLLEKQHLKPVSYLPSFEEYQWIKYNERTVNKDNTILYKSNRYSVPLGTYRPKGLNKVSIEMHKDEDNRQQLVIKRYPEGEVLAKHLYN